MKKIYFDNNKNVISKSLKRCRVNKNLTQDMLAAKMQVLGINVDQQMISKIENNMRFVTDYELACFCHILNVDIATLLSDFFETYIHE